MAQQSFNGVQAGIRGGHPRRMLKKARLLTRPTLADTSPARPESAKTASSPKDAPSPKQGRSELSLYKGWLGSSQLRAVSESFLILFISL
jgi:hypothetical protein